MINHKGFTYFYTGINSHTLPRFTGSTPPTIDCPRQLCDYRGNGNFAIPGRDNYFVQCVNGGAFCQPCFPLSLVFSEQCNQCLSRGRNNQCFTTGPASRFDQDCQLNVADAASICREVRTPSFEEHPEEG